MTKKLVSSLCVLSFLLAFAGCQGTSLTSQTITFAAVTSPVTFGASPVTLSATASSGLTVTLAVTSGPATLSGSVLTYTAPGTVIVAASQAGNSTYAAAPTVSQTIVDSY